MYGINKFADEKVKKSGQGKKSRTAKKSGSMLLDVLMEEALCVVGSYRAAIFFYPRWQQPVCSIFVLFHPPT